MKRLFAILLSIVFCTAALAACGNSQNTGKDAQGKSSEVTVEEQTIFDDQGIKAVVKGYGKYESDQISFDRELLIDVTNNTDKTISFGLRHCSINGYMVETHYDFPVEAGKTATCPAVFDTAKLARLGVTTIADYAFCIEVQDNESFQTLVESDPISIKTSAYEGFEYTYDESGTVLYEKDGVKIVAKDTVDDEYVGPCVTLYVANDTDKNISVSVASGSVNGKEVKDFYFTADPYAGKRSVELLSFGEERPETIKSVTLSFSIDDFDAGEPIVEKTDPASATF